MTPQSRRALARLARHYRRGAWWRFTHWRYSSHVAGAVIFVLVWLAAWVLCGCSRPTSQATLDAYAFGCIEPSTLPPSICADLRENIHGAARRQMDAAEVSAWVRMWWGRLAARMEGERGQVPVVRSEIIKPMERIEL